MPVSKELFTQASSSTRRLSSPAESVYASRRTVASVRVPVLSVHRTSIEPRFWMAVWRLTIMPSRANRIAPRDSVTDITIGRSSGVSPTASATANRNDSSHGL